MATRKQTSDETRTKLEHAALRLFLQRGFNAVGLRDLAAEAGVSLGNVYNHYDGKDMQFANHFVVERLIGAKGYLGLSDRESIQAISKLFLYGLAPRGAKESS